MKLKKIIGFSLATAMMGLCFYYLATSISGQWGDFKSIAKNINLLTLVIVMFVFTVEYLFESEFVQLILRYQSRPIPLLRVTGMFYLSGLAKYLPLKGVDVLGRFYLFQKVGVLKSETLASIVFEALYSITGTLLIVSLMLMQIEFSNLFLTFSTF